MKVDKGNRMMLPKQKRLLQPLCELLHTNVTNAVRLGKKEIKNNC